MQDLHHHRGASSWQTHLRRECSVGGCNLGSSFFFHPMVAPSWRRSRSCASFLCGAKRRQTIRGGGDGGRRRLDPRCHGRRHRWRLCDRRQRLRGFCRTSRFGRSAARWNRGAGCCASNAAAYPRARDSPGDSPRQCRSPCYSKGWWFAAAFFSVSTSGCSGASKIASIGRFWARTSWRSRTYCSRRTAGGGVRQCSAGGDAGGYRGGRAARSSGYHAGRGAGSYAAPSGTTDAAAEHVVKASHSQEPGPNSESSGGLRCKRQFKLRSPRLSGAGCLFEDEPRSSSTSQCGGSSRF